MRVERNRTRKGVIVYLSDQEASALMPCSPGGAPGEVVSAGWL